MNWVLIGTLLGSIVTSQHEDRERCEGRAVILREKGAVVNCVLVNTLASGVTISNSSTKTWNFTIDGTPRQ